MNEMFEFYVQIKTVHVCAVLLSGSLFLLRGSGVLLGGAWPRAALLRYASWTIDTVLLTAALMLATMLPPAVFSNGWLWVKLPLVVAYVVAGILALRAGSSRRVRIAGFAGAVLLYALIASIAYAHDPRGPLVLFTR